MPKPSKDLIARRVRLVKCNDTLTELKTGSEGTVTDVDDLGTLHVDWDDGSRLGLCWDDGDRWSVLSNKAV